MQETQIAVLRTYLIKFMQAIIELIFILPLLLIASLSIFPGDKLIAVFLGFPMCYLAGIFLCRILKTRHKTVYYFSYMMLGAAASLLVFGLSAPVALFFYWVMVSILVHRGVHITNTSWIKQSPLTLFGFQLAVYFASYFVFLIAEDFRPYLYIIKAGGVASVFLFLIISSFDQLKLAILSDGPKKYIPNSLLKSNITISLLLFIFILVISQIRQFWNAIWMVLKPVLGTVTSILTYLTSITLSDKKIAIGNHDLPPAEEVASKSNIIYEIILGILGAAVVVIMAAMTITVTMRLASFFVKWFSGKLNISEGKDTALGYTDEKENLLKSGTNRFGIFKKKLFVRNIKESGWKDMKSNNEKVRYIYKQTILRFIKMGYGFRSSLTPVEVGIELDGLYSKDNSDIIAIAMLYNKAKYGSENISDRELESLLGNAQVNQLFYSFERGILTMNAKIK